MSRFAVLASAVLLAGCHFRANPVPIIGERTSIAALAGTWSGAYHGTASGRTGSIVFTIRVSADSAFGDVLMETPPGVSPIQATDDPTVHRTHASASRALAIKFVEIAGGNVEGALEPYIAPDCDCVVTTTFTGSVRADTVRGTFVTRGRLMNPQTGVWSVTRSR